MTDNLDSKSDAEIVLSIIVPAYNEQDSIEELYTDIGKACDAKGYGWELIFIDDGSTDATPERLRDLAQKDGRVRVVTFRRNFGKAAALDAGFQRASGDIIITADADLQDDPAEIPNFVARIKAGYDVVSGWKQTRHDPLGKTLPSKLFNEVVSRVSGIRLHDFNCGFKAYRPESVKGLRLFGELHRFIPVILHWRGYRVGEMVVNHRPRKFGHSKYGIERLLKGLFDLMTVMLTTRFSARPLHIFGGAGFIFGATGALCLFYLAVLWLLGLGPIGNRPLLTFAWLFVVVGVQLISMGLLAELIQRQRVDDPLGYVIKSDTKTLSRPAADKELSGIS